MDTLEELLATISKENNGLLYHTVNASKPVDLQSLITEYQKKFPDSNIASSPDLYAPSNSNVRSFPQGLNVSGFVLRAKPSTIFSNQNELSNTTVPHELAHVQQHQSGDKFIFPKKSLSVNMDWLDMQLKSKEMNQKDDTWPTNMHTSPRELAASLQGQEALNKQGTNILDTEYGRKLADTPRKRRLLESAIMPDKNKFYKSDYKFKDSDITDLLRTIRSHIREFTSK